MSRPKNDTWLKHFRQTNFCLKSQKLYSEIPTELNCLLSVEKHYIVKKLGNILITTLQVKYVKISHAKY